MYVRMVLAGLSTFNIGKYGDNGVNQVVASKLDR